MSREFVLVSQGMEIMRTKSQEVAINTVKKMNDEWFDYKQRCEDNYENYADNYVELYIEDDHEQQLQQRIDKALKHTHEMLGFLENCVGGNEQEIQHCIKIFNKYLELLKGGNNE